MNRIDRLFRQKKGKILSVYFTAGYPALHSTAGIIRALAKAGVDMIEIGIPFSDPMADGPVIQHSNNVALRNGMNLKLLFKQLEDIRSDIKVPLLLMGYLNPVLQFGLENFCKQCREHGIDGTIIPDLPPDEYFIEYRKYFEINELHNILLISPQSSNGRISAIDKISRGFIYMVSSSSVTGACGTFSREQISYFERVHNMGLKNPLMIGFGISSYLSFANSCRYASGAIVGSAFIKMLSEKGASESEIRTFIQVIKGDEDEPI